MKAMIQTITSLSALSEELHSMWPTASSVFQHPGWLEAWTKHLLPSSAKLTAFTQTTKQGKTLWPTSIDETHTVQWLGAPAESDFLDVLTSDPDSLSEQYAHWLEYCFTQLSTNKVALACLRYDSPSRSALQTAAAHHSLHFQEKEQTVSPAIVLPTTTEAYWQSLPSETNKKFRRLKKKSLDEEIIFSQWQASQSADYIARTFITLHKASSPVKATFWNPAREAFITDAIAALAPTGLLKVFVAEIDGLAAAIVLIFDWHNEYWVYNSGVDAYRFGHLGVGTLLTLHTIETAIKEGKKTYDLLRGDEAYKFELGAQAQSVWDVTITRP